MELRIFKFSKSDFFFSVRSKLLSVLDVEVNEFELLKVIF